MSKNPWLRLYTETVDDEKLRLLAFEDRWHFIAILCCKGAGLLDAGDSPGLLRRKIAVKLGLSPRELEEVARRLEEVGLIDAGTFQPLAWDDRQFKSDTSTERVKRYRERMKRGCNVSETAQETDTETDTEEDKEAKASLSATKVANLPPPCPHEAIVALYHEILPANPVIKIWDGSRADALRTRWREDPKRQNLEYWERFFRHVAASPFLTGKVEGKDGRVFLPGLEWLVKASNFAKIIEGRYHERKVA